MRQILLLFFLILLAFVCGSLLSYPVYRLVLLVTEVPFNKIVSQLISLCGLLFVFLYLRINHYMDRKTAGFDFTVPSLPREFLSGLLAGVVIMFTLIFILLMLGTHHAEPELQFSFKFIISMLFKAIIAGLFVAIIEEVMYRGALLGGLQKTTGILTAVFVCSMIYAAVHFIKIPVLNSDINWYSGFAILSKAFFRFGNPAILDSFLALFAFGVLLSMIRINKGNIIQCTGVHAGVVIAIKVINDLTDYDPNNNFEFLVNRYDHLLGYLAFIWLTLLIIVYYRYFMKPEFLPVRYPT